MTCNGVNRAVKYDQDKPDYSLLPPEALEEMSKVLTYGAKKYAPHNWAKGMDWSRLYSAMNRHIWAWWNGEDNDKETGLSHLAHAMCCLAFLISLDKRGVGEDNRWTTIEKTSHQLPTENI
jgi:hypothetical protein